VVVYTDTDSIMLDFAAANPKLKEFIESLRGISEFWFKDVEICDLIREMLCTGETCRE